jgi:hypothetical protein
MSSAFFFHPWGERGQCRSHALTVQEQYGVWGGLSEDERLLLLQKTRHGRDPSAQRARNHESMCVTGNHAIAVARAAARDRQSAHQ